MLVVACDRICNLPDFLFDFFIFCNPGNIFFKLGSITVLF